MVFFEGNDIKDLTREEQQLQTFKTIGEREYRNIAKQTSFLKASYHLLYPPLENIYYHIIKRPYTDFRCFATRHSFLKASYRTFYRLIRREINRTDRDENGILFQNAYFIHSRSDKIAVSVGYKEVPGKDQLTLEQRILLEKALSDWAKTAETLGITPWLVYMPTKRRVIDGHLRFTENAEQEVIAWQPTDLPEFIHYLSEKQGIGFIDVTPALVRETNNGHLTYNPIFDTHLNRHGSLIVAQVIADALSESRLK